MSELGPVIDVGFLSLPPDIQQALTERAAARDLLTRLQNDLYERMRQLAQLEAEVTNNG